MLALNVSIPCESRGLGTRCEVARDQTWRSLFGSSQSRMFVCETTRLSPPRSRACCRTKPTFQTWRGVFIVKQRVVLLLLLLLARGSRVSRSVATFYICE